MKITTQRTMLWALNFALVAGLLGFVFLMYRYKDSARKLRIRERGRLDAALEAIKPPSFDAIEQGGAAARLKTPFDPTFYYAGYIKPPDPVVTTQVTAGQDKPPALPTLLDVMMVSSPSSPGDVGAFSGALVKVKSRPADSNLIWYRPGDVIGLSRNRSESVDDDPVLKRWGGAEVTAIVEDGILCKWHEETDVKVLIGQAKDSERMRVDFPDGTHLGDLKSSGVKRTFAPGETAEVGNEPWFMPPKENGNFTAVEISKTGVAAIETDGERLLEQVSFETTDGTDEGSRALKVSNIPSQFADSGLRDGDVIVKVDSTNIDSKEALFNYVKGTYKNKPFYNVTILRDGVQRTLRVTVPRDPKSIRSPGNLRFGDAGGAKR